VVDDVDAVEDGIGQGGREGALLDERAGDERVVGEVPAGLLVRDARRRAGGGARGRGEQGGDDCGEGSQGGSGHGRSDRWWGAVEAILTARDRRLCDRPARRAAAVGGGARASGGGR